MMGKHHERKETSLHEVAEFSEALKKPLFKAVKEAVGKP
jgi:hypothetical protein